MVLRQGPASREPVVIEEIKINRPAKGSDQEPHVTGPNSLTIPFKNIMLRDADRDQGEGDFEFTRQDLLRIAGQVWKAM